MTSTCAWHAGGGGGAGAQHTCTRSDRSCTEACSCATIAFVLGLGSSAFSFAASASSRLDSTDTSRTVLGLRKPAGSNDGNPVGVAVVTENESSMLKVEVCRVERPKSSPLTGDTGAPLGLVEEGEPYTRKGTCSGHLVEMVEGGRSGWRRWRGWRSAS